MALLQPTEQRNEKTLDIDLLPAGQVLKHILAEDLFAVETVRAVSDDLGHLVDTARVQLAAGGRLHYFGAGASGRLAILDATELTPTFGFPRDQAVAHFPGGTPALVDSTIDLEDGEEVGEKDADQLAPGDIALGITASGSTAYVRGALRRAHERGARTALITCDPASPLGVHADEIIVLDTGAEVLTGSTRLKAGTATKVALNAFSTAVMIGLGRTYSNLMIDMSVTNDKLRERAVSILVSATGATEEACRIALTDSADEIPRALVSMLGGVSDSVARHALSAEGNVRAALALIARSAQ